MKEGTKARVLPFAMCMGSLVVGVVAGVGGANALREKPETPVGRVAPVKKAIADASAGESASVRALRERIRELERQLAGKTVSSEKIEPARPDDARPGADRPRRDRMRENFEKFRTEHPEQFARMEEGRKTFMRQRQQRAQGQMDFLSSIDTSRMSASARETHQRLMDLIAKRQEFESKITPDAVMKATDEERRHGFEEMMKTEREIRELRTQERKNLLRQTAEELGCTGENAQAVVDTISEIYEATSGSEGGGMHGGRGPGRRGSGGRGGRQ